MRMSSGVGKARIPALRFACLKSCTGPEGHFTLIFKRHSGIFNFLYIQRNRRTRSEPLGDPAYSLNHSKGSSLVKTARYFLPPFSVSSVSSVWKLWNLASASLPVSKARKKM